MSKLHAQLALFGAIDEVVSKSENPGIAATVEAFLPGTTGPGQRGWYAELTRFFSRDELRPREPDGSPTHDSSPVRMPDYLQAMAELRDEQFLGVPFPQPLPPEARQDASAPLSRSLYASTILSKLALIDANLPIPGWDPVTADPLNLLLPVAQGSSGGPTPSPLPPSPPPGGFPPPPPPPPGPAPPAPFRDEFLGVADRIAYQALIQGLSLSRTMNADVGNRPLPCTGVLRKVNGQYCSVLTTDWLQPDITLDEMRAVIAPENWPHLCDFFVRMTPQTRLALDNSRGWSRVLETVSGDRTQWEMRTALKFWKGLTPPGDPGDAIYLNYDLDDPRIDDDPLVEVDSGYIWITPIDPDHHENGIRIRTSKAVRIRGLSATATAALGCFFGWGDAASQMLVEKAKTPPKGVVNFGKPSVEAAPAVGVVATLAKPAKAPTARPSKKEILAAAQKVEMLDGWRGALIDNMRKEVDSFIDVATPLANNLSQRWSDGLTAKDIQEFGENAGREMTKYAVALFSAAASALQPPSGAKPTGEGKQ
jgi:hypothetical protein